MQSQIEKFIQYLDEKRKKQKYVDTLDWRLQPIFDALKIQPTSAKVVDNLVRDIWSGYVGRDRAVYRFLNEYANFCAADYPEFTAAFHEHVRETFEGEARKAMRKYKNAFVYIPKDTKIASNFLDGLTNDRFVSAYKSFQEVICTMYENIECGSPFEWGFPAWDGIAGECFDTYSPNNNRVIMIFDALAGSGSVDGDTLIVDKKLFGTHKICKPISKAKLTLNKFAEMGFLINKRDDKASPVFTLTYPDTPDLITVMYRYFTIGRTDKNHVRAFSYRFVEDPAAQAHETFFLAKTDGEPEELRDIYYWHYDEAVKHGFMPQGYEHYIGCYSYKKGSKEWLFLGGSHSYHEEEFLHSPNYKIAVKAVFYNVWETYPEKLNEFIERFPDAFGRNWSGCCQCRTNHDKCKARIMFTKDNRERPYCASNLFFHDPTFDDVKVIYELWKQENNITN